MKITKKVISLGLALVLLVPFLAFEPKMQALAQGEGQWDSFTGPAYAQPGDTVQYNFQFTTNVTINSAVLTLTPSPSGGLNLLQSSPSTLSWGTNYPGTQLTGWAKYTVAASAGTTITVKARMTLVTETGTVSFEATPVTTQVRYSLNILKTTTATTVNRGDSFLYQIVVLNTTGSAATNVTVTDYLNPGLELLPTTTPSPTSSPTATPLLWNLGTIPNNESRTINLWVRVRTTCPTGPISNSASVSADGLGVTTATASPVTVLEPTVRFEKTVSKTLAAPGDTLRYTLTFINPTGSPTITGAYVQDTMPAYLGFVSAPGGSLSGNIITWSIGTINPGQTVSLTFDAQVFTSLTYGTVIPQNIATFSGYRQPGNVFFQMTAMSPTVNVLPAPFIFTKTLSPTIAQPGQQVTFTIHYKNNSLSPITNVRVVDTVDTRFTGLAFSTMYSSVSGNTYTWNIGTLAAGQEGTISFLAYVAQGLAPGTEIPNTAKIVGDGTAEVTSTAKVIVSLPSVLTLKKAVNSDNILPGADALFTITVSNPTTNPTIPTLTITDTLPAELTFKGASQGYTRTDSVVTWTISNLAPGATGTVTLAATVIPTVPVGSTVTNTAVLEVGGLEPVRASASFQVGQAPASPLKVAKLATADSVKGGEYITYIIIYANTGNTLLPGAKIEEYAPANTTFLNGNPSPVVGPEAGKLTWNLGDLPPGANGTIIAQFSVASTVSGGTVIENVAKGKVSGYQDSLSATVYVTVGQVQHSAFIQGYPDGTFRPEKPITRAEIAAILTRIMGLNPQTAPNPNFADVQSTHWAFGYISAVVNAGIMQGYPDRTFRPDQSITRAELATVMVRARGLFPLIVAPPTFPDIAGHWAAGYIEAAQRAMFITGYPSGDFRPDQSITRAETVTLIDRSYGRGPLSGPNVSQTFPDVPVAHWAFAWIAEAAQSHYGVHSVEGKEILINYLP